MRRGMSERDDKVSVDYRIEFRVGINLGDIIVDDDHIYGDGVNDAARLEGIAEPGGICIRAKHIITYSKNHPLPARSWDFGPSRTLPSLSSLIGKLRFHQHDAGDQVLPSIRWSTPRLCNHWAGATIGQGGELDEPP